MNHELGERPHLQEHERVQKILERGWGEHGVLTSIDLNNPRYEIPEAKKSGEISFEVNSPKGWTENFSQALFEKSFQELNGSQQKLVLNIWLMIAERGISLERNQTGTNWTFDFSKTPPIFRFEIGENQLNGRLEGNLTWEEREVILAETKAVLGDLATTPELRQDPSSRPSPFDPTVAEVYASGGSLRALLESIGAIDLADFPNRKAFLSKGTVLSMNHCAGINKYLQEKYDPTIYERNKINPETGAGYRGTAEQNNAWSAYILETLKREDSDLGVQSETRAAEPLPPVKVEPIPSSPSPSVTIDPRLGADEYERKGTIDAPYQPRAGEIHLDRTGAHADRPPIGSFGGTHPEVRHTSRPAVAEVPDEPVTTAEVPDEPVTTAEVPESAPEGTTEADMEQLKQDYLQNMEQAFKDTLERNLKSAIPSLSKLDRPLTDFVDINITQNSFNYSKNGKYWSVEDTVQYEVTNKTTGEKINLSSNPYSYIRETQKVESDELIFYFTDNIVGDFMLGTVDKKEGRSNKKFIKRAIKDMLKAERKNGGPIIDIDEDEGEEEPVTVEEEPVTVEEEPVTVEEEPVTVEEEPVTVEEEEPVTVEEEEPVTVEEEEPVTVEEEEPVTVEEEEPVTVEEEPVTVEEEPVTVEEEPVTVEEEPVTVEEEPVTVEEEPVTVEEEPVTVEEEPVTVEEEPVTVEEEPALSEEGMRTIKEDYLSHIEETVRHNLEFKFIESLNGHPLSDFVDLTFIQSQANYEFDEEAKQWILTSTIRYEITDRSTGEKINFSNDSKIPISISEEVDHRNLESITRQGASEINEAFYSDPTSRSFVERAITRGLEVAAVDQGEYDLTFPLGDDELRPEEPAPATDFSLDGEYLTAEQVEALPTTIVGPKTIQEALGEGFAEPIAPGSPDIVPKEGYQWGPNTNPENNEYYFIGEDPRKSAYKEKLESYNKLIDQVNELLDATEEALKNKDFERVGRYLGAIEEAHSTLAKYGTPSEGFPFNLPQEEREKLQSSKVRLEQLKPRIRTELYKERFPSTKARYENLGISTPIISESFIRSSGLPSGVTLLSDNLSAQLTDANSNEISYSGTFTLSYQGESITFDYSGVTNAGSSAEELARATGVNMAAYIVSGLAPKDVLRFVKKIQRSAE